MPGTASPGWKAKLPPPAGGCGKGAAVPRIHAGTDAQKIERQPQQPAVFLVALGLGTVVASQSFPSWYATPSGSFDWRQQAFLEAFLSVPIVFPYGRLLQGPAWGTGSDRKTWGPHHRVIDGVLSSPELVCLLLSTLQSLILFYT